ncbi:SDR family NAD(P)-dependent oxidoreductase [Shivajiella indica]|uniref:SDR family NAD(P)-dependent oxidoreductase n=1 Tax=Shivajiella indica TaxID=872115 RepID=A0ABW5B9F0_9BACT
MKNKNVVIIGGNSGIGKSVVEQLNSLGANIFSYSKSGRLGKQLDVTRDFEAMEGLPEIIDGVVYCPGSINLKPFHRFSLEDFRQDYEVNVMGAIKVLQACLKGLKKSNSASVILYSTVAVSVGLGFHSSISSAKGALEGLAKSLAAEWAPLKIRVNVIAPSLTDTPLASGLLGNDEKKEASNKRHPLGRYGQPEDIASSTVFLLSDQSSWMTGQVLHLDGGLSSIKSM